MNKLQHCLTWCSLKLTKHVLRMNDCKVCHENGIINPLSLEPYRKYIHLKDWGWSWSSNTLATGRRELTPWKRPWCWKRLKAREGGNRGWDGWMVSWTQWRWVWANSGRYWRKRRPGVLQPTGCRGGHNWVLSNSRKHIQGSWPDCLSFQSNVWIPLTRTTKRNTGTHTALVWSSFWVWGSTFPMLGSLCLYPG